MRYTIQFYGPAPPNRAGDDLFARVHAARFEHIESDFIDLADARSQAMQHVAPGGQFAWAIAFEIMDHEAFGDGIIDDPAVSSWNIRLEKRRAEP